MMILSITVTSNAKINADSTPIRVPIETRLSRLEIVDMGNPPTLGWVRVSHMLFFDLN